MKKDQKEPLGCQKETIEDNQKGFFSSKLRKQGAVNSLESKSKYHLRYENFFKFLL